MKPALLLPRRSLFRKSEQLPKKAAETSKPESELPNKVAATFNEIVANTAAVWANWRKV